MQKIRSETESVVPVMAQYDDGILKPVITDDILRSAFELFGED